jgi:hypothetical protein
MAADLDLKFVCRGLPGRVRVTMKENRDPRATGHDLIAPNFDPETFAGFPIVDAAVEYPAEGPRAIFFWLQIVTQYLTDGSRRSEVDAIPPPYYSYGHRPEFMDAPANPHHPDMDWLATTFRAEDPRVLGSNRLRPLIGFVWGYLRQAGQVGQLLEPRSAEDLDWANIQQQYLFEHPNFASKPGAGRRSHSLMPC